jgi:hypothetical protein
MKSIAGIALRFNTGLVLLTVIFAGCSQQRASSGSPASGNANQPPPTSRETSAQSAEGARETVRDAYRKLSSAYPYRLTETTSAAGAQAVGQQTVRVAEFAAADRVHATLGEYETITIADKHYAKMNGKWTETNSPSKPSGANMEKLMSSLIKDVKLVGPETVNGVPCFAYSLRFEGDWFGTPATGTGKTWIGASDGLPHQADSEMKIADNMMKSHIVYEYNVNVTVDRPAVSQ